MTVVRLRPGARADLPALERVEAAAATLFPPDVLPPALASPMPPEALRACLAAALLWVAEADGAGVVGFIAAEGRGESLHTLEMDVLPSHGRRGIGTRLLRHACQVARERGYRHVTLTTFAHLPWNAPFYERNGFREVVEFGAFPHLAAELRHEQDRGLERRIAMARRVV
jgi:GNAT superfamily N-acetyltransferase